MNVERLPFLSATRFHAEYLDVKPVVMTAMTSKWPARSGFTFERLHHELGDTTLTLRRYAADTAETFLMQTAGTTKTTTLAAWLDTLGDAAWSVRESSELFSQVPALANELDFAGLFPRGHKRFEHYVWIGPAGYTTGLHTDEVAVNLLAHFVGHKTVTFYPPSQTELLYPETRDSVEDGLYSAVNVIAPDARLHPLFAKAEPTIAELTPGDLLYVPRGWWHWVRGHDPTISVSGISHSA